MKFILLWSAILQCVFGTSHVSVKLPYNNPAGVTYVEGSASSDLIAGPSQRARDQSVTAKSTGTETRRNHSEDFQRYEVHPESSTTVSTSKAAMPFSPSILAALSGNYFHPGSISSLHGQQPTFNIASSTPLPAIHYPKVAVYHKMPMNNIGSSFSVTGQGVSSGTSANSPVFVSGFTRTYRPSISSSSPINPTNIPHTYQTTFPTVHPSYSTVTSTVSSNHPTISSTSPTSTVGYTFIPDQGGSIHHGLGGASGVTTSHTTIGSNIGVRAGPGSHGSTYSTVATPTVQSSSVNYSPHVTATQPSFVNVQSPRVSLNQPTTGYFVAAGSQSIDGISVAQGDSQQGEISKTINIAQPAIKTRKYEVRRPAIQKQFYDIEERIIVRPAGTVVLELDHPISQTPKGETIQDIGYHYANGNNLNLEIGTPSENGIISQNNQQHHNIGNVQVQGGNVGSYQNVQNSGVLTTTQAPNIAFTTTTPENFIINTTPYPQDDDTVIVEARTRPSHNIGQFVVRNESAQSVPHDFRNIVQYQHQPQFRQPQLVQSQSMQCTEGCQRQGGVTYSQGHIQGGVTYSQGPIQGGVTYLKDSSMLPQLSQQPQTRYYQQEASDYPQHQSVNYYQPRPQIQQYSHLVQPNEQNFYHQNERTPSYQGQYNQQSRTIYRQSPQHQQYRQQEHHPQQQQAQYYQQETFNNYYPQSSGEQQFAQYYQLRPQMQQHSHLAQQQQQQNFQQHQVQKMPLYLAQYKQQDTTSHKQSAPYQQEREELAQVVEQTADDFQRKSVPFMISVGEPDFHYPPYVENIGSGNVNNMKSAKQVAYNNQDQQQQQKQAPENTASTPEIDEDLVRSPQVSIQSESKGNSSASLTPQQSDENQSKYLNLILAQGGVSEVSGNEEQDQAKNGYLRSRVISATPAPKDAQPAREQVHTRRVVVSQPLETVQEVEVQEPITKFERLSIKQPAQYRTARISNVGAPIYSRPVLHPIAFSYQKVH